MSKNQNYTSYDDDGSERMPPISPIAVCLRQDSGYDVVRIGQWDGGKNKGPYKRLASKVSVERAYEIRNSQLRKLGLVEFVNEDWRNTRRAEDEDWDDDDDWSQELE